MVQAWERPRSFILTMWYVNTSIVQAIEKGADSFILTMWYVNIINSTSDDSVISGFILTMWYVNPPS